MKETTMRTMEITEDMARAAMKKARCEESKTILRELFPEAYLKTEFACGTVFFSKKLGKVYQLRHAPEPRIYVLTDLFTGFNYGRTDRADSTIFFKRNSSAKEIEIDPSLIETLELVEYKDWQKLILDLLIRFGSNTL